MAPEPQAEAAQASSQQGEAGDNTVAFDEKALAEASIHGNAQAFEELYTHYFPRVRAFVLRKTGSRELAEDIAQEAFTKAFERISEFGGPKHFGGWVGTIAANLCTDHFRRKRNSEIAVDPQDGEWGPPIQMDLLRNIQREDTSHLVRSALDRLEPRQRQALLMHEIKGMTCAAVGEQLGITEVAAESLLARARRRLRKEVVSMAAPADLFGLGGIALLPALLRAWRHAKEAFSQRVASVHAAAARGWESVAMSPTASGAKTLIVALGAALAVEAAGAVAPPAERVSEATVGHAAVTTPAVLPADGDASTSEGSEDEGLAEADLSGSLDAESGTAGVSGEGSVNVPDPEGDHSSIGADYEVDARVGADGSASVRARIVVETGGEKPLIDESVEADTD